MLTETNEIRIETSTHCNYNCIVCPRSTFKRKKESMSNDLFDIIIKKTKDELPNIKHITISGFGEFTTDIEWKYKIKKAYENFEKLHIITNFSLFNKVDIDYVLNYITDIRISLYGVSKNVFKNIHNPSKKINFEKLISNLKYLISTKKPHQKIILNFLEIIENHNETQKWINYWKDKVDLIEVWKPHNWIDGKSYRNTCNHRLSTCGRPFKGPIQVQVDGTINVCCFDYNGELLIGDLKKQNFSEIFNSNEMIKIQNLHKNNLADKIIECKICDQRNCNNCKSKQLLFNSKFAINERIKLTSTEYDNIQ